MSWMDVIDNGIEALLGRRYPKCGALGPGGERCGLEPDHAGFHKSHVTIWPDPAETPEERAEIGRRILSGPMPLLSYNELRWYSEAPCAHGAVVWSCSDCHAAVRLRAATSPIKGDRGDRHG